MKNNYIILVFIFLGLSCQKETNTEYFLPGDFQIINSNQKEWFVHTDISQWTEYNNLNNTYNTYWPVWFSEKSLELHLIEKNGKKMQNPDELPVIACELQFSGTEKYLHKKWQKKHQTAQLELSNSENLKKWLGNKYSKIPAQISASSLDFFIKLKSGAYNEIWAKSDLKNAISEKDFADLMQTQHKTFGQLLWLKALPTTFHQTAEKISMDFLCGSVNSKSPLALHLQWNTDFEIENISIQTGKNNTHKHSQKLLAELFSDARKGNYRQIFEKSTASFKNEQKIEQLPDKMIKMLQLSKERNYKLNNLEYDISAYGNQWAYFYEYSESQKWIGINLTQINGKSGYQLDKIVIVE
jgi:hypothetical protein